MSAGRAAALLPVAQLLHQLGTWTAHVVILTVAAFGYHGSAWQLALVGYAQAAPLLLLPGVVGWLLRRYPPPRVAVAGLLFAAACAVGLALATGYPALVALAGLQAIGRAFYVPAVDTVPARLAGEDWIWRVVTLVNAGTNLAVVVGPLIAYGLLVTAGAGAAFLAQAAFYVLAAVLVATLRTAAEAGPGAAADSPAAGRGFAGVLRSAQARVVLGLTFAVWLSYGIFGALEPLYVRDTLHAGGGTLALLYGVFGVGTLLVSPLLLIRRPTPSVRLLALIATVMGVVEMVYIGTDVVAVAIAGGFAWGVTVALFAVPGQHLMLTLADNEVGARMAALRAAQGTGQVLSLALAGSLAALLGAQRLLLAIGAAVFAAGLVAWRYAPDRRVAQRESVPSASA